MTPKQIKSLAKKAGLPISMFQPETQLGDELRTFAELVRNQTLEEAALCADEHKHSCYEGDIDWYEAGRIAAAIREIEEMPEHNNPPAFPTKQPLSSDFLGLTMLDHFAGLAMQGVVNEDHMTQEQMAQWCYEMADAMLKERQKWIK